MIVNTKHTNKTVRFGIVGCGAVVRSYHLPFLTKIPGVEISFLCDSIPRNTLLTQKQFGLPSRTTTTIADFASQVDAALVAVPPRFHAEVSIQLLEMGIDVLCEKPVATTSTEAQKMVDAAERHGRLLAVGHMIRFHSNNQLLRKALQGGMLGTVTEVVAEFGAPLDWAMTSGSYYSRKTTAGGVLFDMGIHLVDRVMWLFGDLHDIECEDDSYGGVESNAILRARLMVDGQSVPCRMAYSWTHGLDNCIRVAGTEATAEARLRDPDVLTIKRSLGGEPVKMLLQSTSKTRSPFHDQLVDFSEAVRERRQPFVTASSAVKVLRAIEAAYTVRTRLAQPWVEANLSAS